MRERIIYWLVERFYNYVTTRDRDSRVTFLNFGFAGDGPALRAGDRGETDLDRRRKDLYLKVAGCIDDRCWDWTRKDVLEVGSGRGGGAALLAGSLGPRSYRGVDLSRKAVKFCEARYSLDNLSFCRGNAEALGFPDASFDAVINIESSHCYPRMPRFLAEVTRALRPNGYLLLADFRRQEGVKRLREHLEGSGLTAVTEEDITAGVLAALKLDSRANRDLVEALTPRWLHRLFKPFAGVEDSGMPESFASRERQYWIFVYQKRG